MVQYECKLCQKSYEVYASWYSHTQLRHRDPRVKCTVCGKLFQTRAQLYAHAFKDRCQAPRAADQEALTYVRKPATLSAAAFVEWDK